MKNTFIYSVLNITALLFSLQLAAQSTFTFDSAEVSTNAMNFSEVKETLKGITIVTNISNTQNKVVKTDNGSYFVSNNASSVDFSFNKRVHLSSISLQSVADVNDIVITPIFGKNDKVEAVVSESSSIIDLNWDNVIAISISDKTGKKLNLKIDDIVFDCNALNYRAPVVAVNLVAKY